MKPSILALGRVKRQHLNILAFLSDRAVKPPRLPSAP